MTGASGVVGRHLHPSSLQPAATWSRRRDPNTTGSIRGLIETVAELTGFRGQVRWDTSKPDGQMFKRFDVAGIDKWLGCRCPATLREGLTSPIVWFDQHYDHAILAVPV